MVWKVLRIGFSLCIFFFLVLQFISPASSIPIAPSAYQQITQDTPPEFVVPSASGIEKLSPDLQVLLQGQSQPAQSLSIQLTEQQDVVVSAIIQPGADVRRYFRRSAASREIAGYQWVTGEIDPGRLAKLASLPAVQAVFSLETYQTAEAPGLEAMRASFPRVEVSQMRALLAQGGPERLAQEMQTLRSEAWPLRQPVTLSIDTASESAAAEITTIVGSAPGIRSVHDVDSVHAQDLHGEGVVVALVDTGVDFAHPDLQGTQKIISAGPYSGWPFSYDVLSGAYYAMDPGRVISPENYWEMAGMTQYARTLPVQNPICTQATCTANLPLLVDPDLTYYLQASWPNTSQSGVYYYSIHPDVNLVYASYYLDIGYPNAWLAPPLIIVADDHQPGVYDTVYTDVNYDAQMSDPAERMDQSKLQGGADLNGDGVWDLSAGMLTWISDGVHQPPGVATLYPQIASAAPPEAGRLVAFVTDMDGHGTNCASEIAGQGQISDPDGLGPSNPLYAGALSAGGVGGAVVQSIAPGAQIAAFQNGFSLPLDAWTLAVLGFDGLPATDDEANIVSNSWGDSRTIEDGWDEVSRFAQALSYITAPEITFLVATGNGGHGYGTTTSPGGGPIIDVGASTAYGSLLGFENVTTDQFLSGEVQPWSNRGPGGLADISPDVVAVGAFAAGANPLNIYFGDGEAAYDVFGGTSLATPVAAGNLALIYQAFRRAHDRWPNWQEARSLLLNGAQDLGYDVLVQGAGNIQAGRSVAIAQGLAPQVTPEQWLPGDYRQQNYPAFPAILHPGEQDTQQFVIINPGPVPLNITPHSRVFTTAHEETFTINFTSPPPSTQASIPVFLEDLTGLINTYQPDMIRAQVILPYTVFDPDRNYYPDSWWLAAFYHWQDMNGDQNLWTDDNQDGRVSPGEIDINAQTGLYEYNRFSSASPISTYLETTLGSQGLSYPHDGISSGIFLGLRCYFCGVSTVLQVRVTFYQQVPWDWMAFSPAALSIPAGGSASFTAAVSVPTDTQPGLYEGAVVLDLGGNSRVIPVAAQVAANNATFALRPSNMPDSPYENGRVVGGFNWNWRYESGDWQTFYFDVPDGMSQPGKSLVVETQWSGPDTDVDTWVFGVPEDSSPPSNSAYFGPQDMQQIGGSADTYIGGGKFLWDTNTGYPHEIISAPLRDGLGMLTLHNVLNDGTQFAEGVSGAIFTVENQPAQVNLLAQPQSAQIPRLSGAQTVTLLSTGDFADGINIRAYGMAAPILLTNQLVSQDIAYNICGSSWVYQKSQGGLVINQGGLLEIKTRSLIPDLDLDLYLYRDNGDGIWNCSKDRLVTYATGATANEQVKIYFPQDGRYWIAVHGYYVPHGPLPFDIDIHALNGTGVTLRNTPIGALRANQPVDFTVNIDAMYALAQPSALEGLLLIGPPSMPNLLEIPLYIRPTVLIYPEPVLTVSTPWKQDGPRAFTLSFQNQGAQSEQVHAVILLPHGLFYSSSAASAPGEPAYDPLARTVSWDGTIGAGEKITITVDASDDPAAGQGPVTLQAQVSGQTSGQQWNTDLAVNLNTYPVFLPIVIH